jgi:hypothetical protein
LFKIKLPRLFNEVKTSLLSDGEIEFAKQLDNCIVKSCESIISDNSAFDILFEGYRDDIIDDSFHSGEKPYTVMVCYSIQNKVIGITVIGCENTSIQEELNAVCT